MNPNDGATDIVDQVHFGWKPDGRGLQAVASSGSMEFARNCYETLKMRIRLESFPHLVTPSEALSYLVFDNLAVVVWRCDDGRTAGRNSARALIGSPKILTPELATTLSGWGGWRIPPEANELAPVYADDLVVRNETRQDFADQARNKPYPALVCAVLARMLAEPGRPVSIVGTSALKPEVVVWALQRCGAAALPDIAHLRWTFSTWEVRHDAQAGPLPEIVFLPEAQANPPSSISRIQVELRGWAPTPQDQLAQAWFEHCFSDEPQPLDRRVAVAQSSPTPSRVQINSDFHGSTAVEPVLVRTNGGPEEDAAMAQPHRVPAHAAAAAGAGLHSVRLAAADPESEALAARLASSATLAEFTAAIAQIPRDSLSIARGDVLKAILKPDVLSGVTLFLEETASADLAKTLSQALFGPDEDLRLHSQRVAKLIQGGQSTALARRLAELGLKQGDALAGEVARSAALRLIKRGEPADTPTRMRGMAARVARRYSDRRLGWVAVLATVALLGAAFLGGLSLSTGNDGQSTETAAQLQNLQAAVDALPHAQPAAGQGQAKPLTTLPWTVSGPPPPFKVALVVVDQTDKQAHGVECQPPGGPKAPAVLWKCSNAPNVNSPGAVTIMEWPGDKPPANITGLITQDELKNGTVVFTLG